MGHQLITALDLLKPKVERNVQKAHNEMVEHGG